MEELRAFSIGSVAGMIGKIVEMPFDTVKVRIQTQAPTPASAGNPQLFTGSIDCFQKTMRQEGIAALYRGLASPLFGAAFETAVLFSIYGRAKNFFIERNAQQGATSRSLSMGQICAAGAFTGFFTGVVLTPIELIKCRMQVQRAPVMASEVSACMGGEASVFYTGAMNCLSHTLRKDGLTGLFRGGISTILREVPGTAVWFGAYEGTCDLLVRSFSSPKDGYKPTPGPLTYMIGGAVAGCAYWLIPYPIDTIKTRIQTQAQPSTQWQVFRTILAEEGIRGLYKGVGFTMLRAIPSSAAMFFAYEQLSVMFSSYGSSSSQHAKEAY